MATSLTPGYAALAAGMHPVVHALLVENCDPASIDASELLRALNLHGSHHDWESRRPGSSTCRVPATLDLLQCAALRAAVDAASMDALDSVDGLLEYQLTLDVDELEGLVGSEAYLKLTALAAAAHVELQAAPNADVAAAAAKGGIILSPLLPDEPHTIFVRSYSAGTRPWVGFHYDRSSLTLNVALSDDDALAGGSLLAVVDGKVERCAREIGTATLHASTLLHAVTRVYGSATRYSLVLLYRQICPNAAHRLVECSAATMGLLYPLDEGSYSCDACGDSALELAARGSHAMWHCADGCEYDLCGVCHDSSLVGGVQCLGVD